MKKLNMPSLLIAVVVWMMAVPFGAASAAGAAPAAAAPQAVAGGKALADIQGHWAQATLEEWFAAARIAGDGNGSFKPKTPITRAELAALINRSFGYSAAQAIPFSDVPPGKWYADEVAKAVAAGYAAGFEDGTFRPEREVTRQELAVMVAKLLKLDASDSGDRYADAATGPAWSKGAIGAVVDRGIMLGAGGKFMPKDKATRAEAVVILDRALKQRDAVYAQAGVYGPATGTEAIDRDVVIDAPGITLRNVEIDGNLTITANVGDGDVYLKNVKVGGTTTVNGGGEHSIHFENSVVVKIVVDKKDGSVRIVAEGSTSIQEVTLQSGATVEGGADSAIRRVTLPETLPPDSAVSLSGTFEDVDVLASAIVVHIPKGSIGSLNVAPSAGQSSVQTTSDTQIVSLVLNAVAKVMGQGVIQKASIQSDGASIEATPKQLEVGAGVKAEVGGQPAVGGSGDNTGGSPGSGGSGGNPPAAVNKSNLKAAIDQAQTVYDRAIEGIEKGQYPYGAKAALQSAIEEAADIYKNARATQQQVNAAAAALNLKLTEFTSRVVERSIAEALAWNYVNAKYLYRTVPIGTEPGDTTEAGHEAFGEAIRQVRAVVNNPEAAGQAIEAAYRALNDALVDFGDSMAPFVTEPLRQALEQANQMLAQAVEGTEPGQYKAGAKAILALAVNGWPKDALAGWTDPNNRGWWGWQDSVYSAAAGIVRAMNQFEADKAAESDAVIAYDSDRNGNLAAPYEERRYFSIRATATGTVYAVPYSQFPETADDVARDAAATVEVTEAGQWTKIGATDLPAGNYKLYLVDGDGKLSKAFVGYHVPPVTTDQASVASAYTAEGIANTIRWVDTSTPGADGPVHYRIMRKGPGENEGVTIVTYIPSGTQQFVDNDPDLLPNTTYEYWVIFETIDGSGEVDGIVQATTPAAAQ